MSDTPARRKVDTGAQSVRHLAETHFGTAWNDPTSGLADWHNETGEMLLALLRERDELRSALAAARREGAEEMRTRAAAACLRRAHASAEDDLTPIEEAVRDEAIYCARAIRALEIEVGDAP